jgi:hypothetical protein
MAQINEIQHLPLEDGNMLRAKIVRGQGVGLNKHCADAWIKNTQKQMDDKTRLQKRMRKLLMERQLEKTLTDWMTPTEELGMDMNSWLPVNNNNQFKYADNNGKFHNQTQKKNKKKKKKNKKKRKKR